MVDGQLARFIAPIIVRSGVSKREHQPLLYDPMITTVSGGTRHAILASNPLFAQGVDYILQFGCKFNK